MKIFFDGISELFSMLGIMIGSTLVFLLLLLKLPLFFLFGLFEIIRGEPFRKEEDILSGVEKDDWY